MILNNFFDKFIFTSQLKFKDYNFTVLDIPFVIVPTEVLIGFSEFDDPTINKAIYYAFKKSSQKNLFPKFKVGATKTKFLDLVETFFAASGWGLPTNIQVDETNHRAVVVVSHSPLAKHLQGRVKNPVDHYYRAILAAAFSEYFGSNVECVESDCRALHPGDCTFLLKPLKEFDFTKEVTQRQLSLESV
ncbi:MAG: 4-vinyl reductase [Candidatus Diapherotrites archaeon]|nr:4-vinyl reductase [Candidatus Diapherotrites archaeon]MDZ4256896.1 4-vinyl reductase [archaeon]